MKRERRRLRGFLCCFFALLGSGLWQVKAADPLADAGNTEKVVDAYITVMTMAYPPAGGALAAAKGLMNTLGFFSKPDAVGEAIKAINQRLDAIEARMDTLEKNLQETRNEVFRNANLQNTRELRRHRNAIEQVLLALQNKPTDKFAKEKLVLDARQVCDAMLEDRKLWDWSDLVLKDHNWDSQKIKQGTMLDPDFKPMPTLEVYASALATWMAAIEYAGGGSTTYVKQTFTKDLQRHIDFLTVRANWNELNAAPQTLPEEIQARVVGIYVPTSRRPDANQVCTIAEYTQDSMAREVKLVGNITYVAQGANDACNVPTNLLNRSTPKEDELETNYGLDVIQLLAQKLTYLRDKGTLREQFIGTFDTSVRADEFNVLYTVAQDGELMWRRHDMAFARGGKTIEKHGWKPEQHVGEGWAAGFKDILPGGTTVIYAIEDTGTMRWYKHTGATTGSRNWLGPVTVGTGWNQYSHVVAMGEGVFYGIRADGLVIWHKHTGYQNAKGGTKEWMSQIVMNSTNRIRTFLGYKTFFSGGKGVIYAVAPDGKLYWFRHRTYLNAVPAPVIANINPFNREQDMAWINSWDGPKKVGDGWGEITKLFSPGEGHIYAVMPNGDLMYYRHTGWESGSYVWDEVSKRKIAEGWDTYKFAFARNITSDLGSGDPNVDIVVH